MRIVIVGGGPGGLYLAALLKRAERAHDVVLVERNLPDDPFGFGVVFSDNTMSSLAAGDPAMARRLSRLGPAWDTVSIRLRGERIDCRGIGFTAVGRARLLQMLQQEALAAGADLRFATAVERPGDVPDHDLLVAADGGNSVVRSWSPEAFGYRAERGEAKFIWLGTTRPHDALTFVFANDDHGTYGLHAYPYDDQHSTFLVETDPTTWAAAGLDGFDHSIHALGTSDLASVRHLRQVFVEHLDGHELIASNSRWMNFTTVHNDRWAARNTVLIGDAAHTAHFSVGSGTRMAMEDALGLAQALARYDDIPEALASYEAERRPAVERIQAAAAPSLRWWERFASFADIDVEQFALHFLTRTPRITRASLQRLDPEFVARVDRWWDRTPRRRSVRPNDAVDLVVPFVGRAGPVDVDAAVRRAAELQETGARAVALRVDPAAASTAGGRWNWRLLLASERVRLEVGIPTVVALPDADLDLAWTVIQAGRADGVRLGDGTTVGPSDVATAAAVG